MENFFCGDKFCREIDDLLIHLDLEEEDLQELPDDYALICHKADLEPIIKFSTDWIFDQIDEERFPEEEDDKVVLKLQNILKENINFDEINRLMPQLYYESRTKFTITKKDLLDY